MRLHNSGCNCIAGQVLVLSADWAQKEEFLDLVRAALASAPSRPGWYPGLADRVVTARENYDSSEAVGGTPDRTPVTGLSADDDSAAYSTEYFGPVLAATELPGTPEAFLRTAIDFANDWLHGTLGANVLIHPNQIAELGRDQFDKLLVDLRHGTIAVNAWTGVGFLLPLVTRRPFPRSIAAGELSLTPVPPWFVHNKTAATTGKRLVRFFAKPGLAKLPEVFTSALRG